MYMYDNKAFWIEIEWALQRNLYKSTAELFHLMVFHDKENKHAFCKDIAT